MKNWQHRSFYKLHVSYLWCLKKRAGCSVCTDQCHVRDPQLQPALPATFLLPLSFQPPLLLPHCNPFPIIPGMSWPSSPSASSFLGSSYCVLTYSFPARPMAFYVTGWHLLNNFACFGLPVFLSSCLPAWFDLCLFLTANRQLPNFSVFESKDSLGLSLVILWAFTRSYSYLKCGEIKTG